MAVKVLLDTDIGSDIDDAVCLAYLLAQPECELAGITTVTGDVVKRAQLASALCKAAGKNIPIYPGISRPLIVPSIQQEVPQAVALSNWEYQKEFPQYQAIEFMRRIIRQNPGEVVLLPIGPQTNIGVLFTIDPEIPALLKGLVIMGGVFNPQIAPTEWNIIGDPHAAAIVYKTPVKIHRSIGLDVTLKVTMPAVAVREKFSRNEILRVVLSFAEVWFRNAQTMVFHDPLAAVTVFDEQVCKFTRGNVNIELKTGQEFGASRWIEDVNGLNETTFEVDVARFFNDYFTVFK